MIMPVDEVWGHIECEGNPGKWVCSCKGFKGYEICSHILAISHILSPDNPDKQYNVRAELRTIGKKASKKSGGNVKRPPPALTRAPAMQLDSSDEEEERLLALGAEGK